MILVDSHCHVHDRDFGVPAPEVLQHAHQNHVDKLITIGTSAANNPVACDFAAAHAEVWWTYGYHPHEYNGDRAQLEADLASTQAILDDPKLVAIGEIGLDYHYEPYDKAQQIDLLQHMLQIAQDRQLPVSFHVRDAFDDFWPIFDNFHLSTSVMHSFSDNQANLEQSMKRGLYFGVNGLSTFAKIPHAPIERIILETDAPYLTPKPFRGTINKPGYIYNIAEWAAQYYQLSLEQVADITTKNIEQLFKI